MARTIRKVTDLPGFRGFTWLFFAYLYAPLVLLVVFSFNATRSGTVWSGFSLTWYAKIAADSQIQRAALNSLTVAVCATAIATVVATAAALAMKRGVPFFGKKVTGGLIMTPLVVPEIVTAVATLLLFSAIGLSLGLGNIILAHVAFCIPFAYLPIRARLERMDESIELAARDLYATPWQTLRTVTLPLLAPGIVSGALLALITSIDDFIITMMVAEPGATTLPLYIYGMLRLGVSPEINAISTILLAVSVVVVTLSHLLTRRR